MKKKKMLILVVLAILFGIILCAAIFLFWPRKYNSFLKKAEIQEVDQLLISFMYDREDEHSDEILEDKYCSRYLIDDKETIKKVQKVLQNVSLRPEYGWGNTNDRGLIWQVDSKSQGEYDVSMANLEKREAGTLIYVSILEHKRQYNAQEKNGPLPVQYKISEEDNEKIIQVLFEAIKANIKDLTIQDALRLSEENAPWKEFMYYYAKEGDLTSTNQVFLPIKDTGMQLEIWYERIHTDPEYIEPIEKAILYDAEGNEYEFFSEEARDILRKGESES